MARPLRLLLVADTHLGFDLPRRPRVERRRRGPEFFDAFRCALAPARAGEVDLVVHGGDLLYRSRVPAWLVHEALEPLREVADLGVPVLIVPGNHERSRLPYPLLALHPMIHLFDRPRTVCLRLAGVDVALSGFPFLRQIAGEPFEEALAATGWAAARGAAIRLLCLHQAVEGARVGTQSYTFRRGVDVLPGRQLPAGFAAVLSGHIHRAQRLRRDLKGRPLAAPVLYPGSTQRTSFAERLETKGFCLLELGADGRPGGRLLSARFVPLHSRPMVTLPLAVSGLDGPTLEGRLLEALDVLDRSAIVRLELRGRPTAEAERVLSAPSLRRLAPATMNIELPGRHSFSRSR